MNTKFSFALLMIVIAMIATACTPAITGSSTPTAQAARQANPEISVAMPVTGGSASTTTRAKQAPRLWSGEVFLSDNDHPDAAQNAQPAANQKTEGECTSADSLPRRYGGCTE